MRLTNFSPYLTEASERLAVTARFLASGSPLLQKTLDCFSKVNAMMIPSWLTTPSCQASSKITKGNKDGLASFNRPSVALSCVFKKFSDRFPSLQLADPVGSLFQGAVVFSKDGNHPDAYCVVPSAMHYGQELFIDPQTGKKEVRYGKVAPSEDVQFPNLRDNTEEGEAQVQRLDQMLRHSNKPIGDYSQKELEYGLQQGVELEGWVQDKKTHQLVGHDFKKLLRRKDTESEVLTGSIEIDGGIHRNPAKALLQLGALLTDVEHDLKKNLGDDYLLNFSSALLSGSPTENEINVDDPYMLAISRRLFYKFKVPEGRDDIRTIVDKVAKQHGFENFEDMREVHNDYRAWALSAYQVSFGLPHFKDKEGQLRADGQLFINTLNALCSEFGALARLLCLSSGATYLDTNLDADEDGKKPRDVREVIRNMLGTALPMNEPIESMAHILEILLQTITAAENGADRLDRAVVVHTINEVQEDGSVKKIYRQTGHGVARARIMEILVDQLAQPTVRVELTGISATNLIPLNRALAIIRVLGAAALRARAKHQTIFEFIEEKTGLSKTESWGDHEALLQDYNMNGSSSQRVQQTVERFTHFLDQFNDYPGLENDKQIAKKAVLGLLQEGSLEDFTLKGFGTLGHVMNQLDHLTPQEKTLFLTELGQQEREFLASLSEEEANQVLKGELGFTYVWPKDLRRAA